MTRAASEPLPCAFLYDETLGAYELSESHPFRPERIEATRSLLQAVGVLHESDERRPARLALGPLERVHEPAYVETVRALSRGEEVPDAFGFGLGTSDNPVFPSMHEAVLRVCDATVSAVDLVASGAARRAVTLSGGLHHAFPGRASGFCVYNDLALAIEHATRRYGLRVAYVDVDAHHGDGVQSIFYGRGDVMTISLHESGRYLFPGTGHTYELGQGDGRGLSVNVPLEPFTEDASFDECFEAVVPRALEAFAPDLIVLQAGADMHRLDPLADLALSTRSFERTFRRMSELADAHAGGRIVATGGGGYDPFRTVPRVWALLWCALSGRDVPDELPESWRERWAGRASVPLPARLHDDTASWRPVPRRDAVASHNRVAVRRLFDSLEPIWREIGTRSTAARAAAKPHPQEES